jgi:peptidoglycan/xylan/chitin deacetylase (PgdA/CDA1 family)
MDERYNYLRTSEYLPEDMFTEEEKIVLQAISEGSKKDYQHILFKDKIKKYFKRTYIFAAVSIVMIVAAFIVYLYSINKKKERFITHQNIKIAELENRLKFINEEEEEQARRIDEYRSILKQKILNIPDLDLSKKISENIQRLSNELRRVNYYNIIRGNPTFKEISLTFDLASGDDCKFVYNLIKKYNIKITLFISNERPGYSSGSLYKKSNVHWIKKLAALGSMVEFGNHSWSHYNLVKSLKERSLRKRYRNLNITKEIITSELLHREFSQVEDRFYNLTGRRLSKIWRAPYGAISPLILKMAASLGYEKHIYWSNNGSGNSLDIPDYISKRLIKKRGKLIKNPLYITTEEALKKLFDFERTDKNALKGSIILMHLGTNRKIDRLINILPAFIEAMQKKGYKFVSVSEVLNNNQD